MKRIVICMDGTWQSLRQDSLTNIGIIARSISHKETIKGGGPGGTDRYVEQTVIYTHGVGSTIGAVAKRGVLGGISESLNRLAGGAFGEGLEDGIVDTYLRLVFDYEKGDQIFIFGFSRGAFAARRLSGFINSAGIVSRRFAERAWDGFQLYMDKPRDAAATPEALAAYAEEERKFRRAFGKGGRNEDGSRFEEDAPPPIRYLGVFDTVVQKGAAEVLGGFLPGVNKRYKFKNLRVASNVESARHAVAIDENRVGFPSTQWQGLDESNEQAWANGADRSRKLYDQRWFVGSHADVGGGVDSRLSALALQWIVEGAQLQGLRFYGTYGEDSSPLADALREHDMVFTADITWPKFPRVLHPMNIPLRGRRIWSRRERPTAQDADIIFDPSVMKRWRELKRYRPAPLAPFKSIWTPPKRKRGEDDATV